MSSKKQISRQLNQLSTQLKLEKTKQQQYKAALMQTGEHRVAVVFALFSSLFMGWQLARGRDLMGWLKRLLRFGFMSAVSMGKTRLIAMAKAR